MNKRTAGLILMILGVVIAISLIIGYVYFGYPQWRNLDPFKAEEFPTFWDFYWGWYSAESLLSIAIGGVFVYAGIRLRKKSVSDQNER